MAVDTPAALDALLALVEGLPGMQQAYRGVPESFGSRVGAYVAVVGMEPTDKATGLLQVRLTLRVAFTYRVKGAEATAEAVLAALADAFVRAFWADRDLGGAWQNGRLSAAVQGNPDYEISAAQELRVLPFDAIGEQREPYANTGQP